MNVRPLIVRELRAEARRAGSYWVRCVAAGILTAVFVWSVWDYAGAANNLGRDLFGALSQGMVLGVLVIVSALTSDSISREKREGTIGLLFLTPLNAREIVIGKALLHALRALVILLGMLPIMAMPFLLGGIRLKEVVENFLGLGIVFCVAISSGIIASVYNTRWIQAMVWAVVLAAAQSFGLFFALVNLSIRGANVWTRQVWPFGAMLIVLQLSLAILFGRAAAVGSFGRRSRWRRPIISALAFTPVFSAIFCFFGLPLEKWALNFAVVPLLICFALMGRRVSALCRDKFQWLVWGEILLGAQFLGTVVCAFGSRRFGSDDIFYSATFLAFEIAQLWFVVLLAGVILKRQWDEDSESEREPLWVRFFSQSAFWRGAFHWDTRKARDRNPIAWLQEYNWTSRLTKWGWCAVLFFAELR